MRSRWGETEACEHPGANDTDLAQRIYSARLIGSEPDLVLHGGGNVSVKTTARTPLGEQVEVIHVKASGCDMAELTPEDLPAMELAPLRRLRALDRLDDDEMVNQIRRAMLDANAPTPSIETLVHAFLPYKFVDHSHADAVLCLTNQPNPEELVRAALSESQSPRRSAAARSDSHSGAGVSARVAILPYIKPGFDLAKAVAETVEPHPDLGGIVLIQHGLITFADDARTSYERHITIVDACERFIEGRLSAHGGGATDRNRSLAVAARKHAAPNGAAPRQHRPPANELAALVAPMLRGLLAHPTGDEDQSYARSILEWRCGDDVMAIINGEHAARLAVTGPLTGDHLIRTKPWPMLVERPAWPAVERLHDQLKSAIEAYRRGYAKYLRTNGAATDGVDLTPRVVLLPGAGLFAWGMTKRDAVVAADIAQHTLIVKARADAIGSYVSLPEDRLFEMEYRGLQRSKLSGRASRPLAGQVVVISGGAGAIGAGIAEVCVAAGAHVAVADLDLDRAEAVVERINAGASRGESGEQECATASLRSRLGKGALESRTPECATAPLSLTQVCQGRLGNAESARISVVDDAPVAGHRADAGRAKPMPVAVAIQMDVTDESSVAAGFAQVVRTFGGVDVVVPNAGVAHVATIESLSAADFRRVMDVNATGCLLFMREGVRILKVQGLGGHVILISSKNVPAPGKDFAAYSASKAAAHQLGRVAAIELAPLGIRVNMIAPDAVFGDEQTPSGLWAAVGPDRAKSRNLAPDDLAEFYRQRSLLKLRVHPHHVGRAVVFFASSATPTTGAVLPVDGGLSEAFPR